MQLQLAGGGDILAGQDGAQGRVEVEIIELAVARHGAIGVEFMELLAQANLAHEVDTLAIAAEIDEGADVEQEVPAADRLDADADVIG